jgi:xylulose-5-phosphate/fructose-6-phosphate phosphoketolase
VLAEPTRVLGRFLRDVMRANEGQRNFRLFAPDENDSNRLGDVYEATGKQWNAETLSVDEPWPWKAG